MNLLLIISVTLLLVIIFLIFWGSSFVKYRTSSERINKLLVEYVTKYKMGEYANQYKIYIKNVHLDYKNSTNYEVYADISYEAPPNATIPQSLPTFVRISANGENVLEI